ncbi:MAG TPA: thioredoxin family protein [Flavobacteriales bacterium]|nr:thioredoxin family protein [Flavobacteriales bacterium]HPH83742.1 thioredoxin family protein [Flavobacteriales bacterium]
MIKVILVLGEFVVLCGMLLNSTLIRNAFTWERYMALMEQLVADKQTTGEQTEEHIHFTELNIHRLKRVYKTLKFDSEVANALAETPRQLWVVISEAWCGDASQLLPVMARMADLSATIELRIVLRDENPELMDQFLTNGGKAIPKLICMNPDTFEVMWNWGPRPLPAVELAKSIKSQGGTKEEIGLAMQEWYNKDKGQTTIQELLGYLTKP